MPLELSPLINALLQLEEAIAYSQSEMAKQDARLFKQFRNSVIQCFEFTYELSWKMIKRQLSLDLPNPSNLDAFNFNDLMREAAQYGLIDDPGPWIRFRKERNVTSHTYNENLADEVYQIALVFFVEAKQLLATLKNKNP